MTVARRVLITCSLLYAGSQVLFLVGIESVGKYVFDEVHYVPAAKRWLALEDPANLEHPPLGKQLMALGIAVWGDRPLGWRFMSAVFGGLTLVGVYLWGRALFRSERAALLTAFVTLGNQVLYVQSRVGMLDGFMCAESTRGFRWGSALLAAGALALFVFFFDILCGAKIGSEVFRSRMWLRSWY